MKSKAVVFTGIGQVEYCDVETPDPGPGDVVVRTKYSWISNGTESSFLRGERVGGIQAWKPGMKLPYPMVPGYQKVGIVESIGKKVRGLMPGQWVFATMSPVNGMEIGYGGHLEMGVYAASQVLRLPSADGIPGHGLHPEAYSGLVLTQVGYNSGIRGQAGRGEPVAVIGDGMVGLWAARTLQNRGCRVALVGRHDFRLGLFGAYEGGHLRVNAGGGKRDEQVLEELAAWAAPSGGLRIIVDTVGNDTNARLNAGLLRLLRRGGHFVAAGHHGANPMIDQTVLTAREITLHCPGGWTMPRLRKTMQWVTEGKLDTAGLITHRFPARAADEAWRTIREERQRTVGVILEWGEEHRV